MEHKTFLGKLLALDFKGVWSDIKATWKRLWEEANHDLLDFAVNTTSLIKDALFNENADILVSITSTKLDDNILWAVRERIIQTLSAEILFKKLNPGLTDEEMKQVFSDAIDQFGGLSDYEKQRLYTTLAADIYKAASDGKFSFAEIVTVIQQAWKLVSKQP